ncbi:hypothetical protein OAN83_01005 [Alphaproteobacteria bacterium]|nr:hypothetical protein [Alphaproteobacteria bacterium]
MGIPTVKRVFSSVRAIITLAISEQGLECPSDIVAAIGGWKTFGVDHGYGNGYSLEVLERWMKNLERD